MEVFIIGAYGCGNCGDDAILQAVCKNLKGYSITATTGGVKDIAQELPVRSVPCRLNEGFSFRLLFQMIPSCFQILHGIICADALLFGGGSLIHDHTIYNLPFMFLWHRAAEVFRKPIYYVCIGIGPIKTKRGKKACRKWLSRANGVFPRDERGMKICQENGILNCIPSSDAAFSYNLRMPGRKMLLDRFGLDEEKYVCITASQWLKNENYWRDADQKENAVIIQNFCHCVAAVQKRLKCKVVFIASEQRDHALGELVRECITEDFVTLPVDLGCAEVEEIVASSYFMFGMRMHPLIFALRQGVPAISIVYDDKVRELMKRMDLLDFSVELNELDPDHVVEKLETIERNRKQIVAKIKENARKNAENAKKCFEKIKYDLETG